MQVSFFAPSPVPSAPAAVSAAGLPSPSVGDKVKAFASLLDSRSEGLPKPGGAGKGKPAPGGTGAGDPDEHDLTSSAPDHPKAEEHAKDDHAVDWNQRACDASVVVAPVLPLPTPLPAVVPAVETGLPGNTDTEAAGDPLPAQSFVGGNPAPNASLAPTKEGPGNLAPLPTAANASAPKAPTSEQSALPATTDKTSRPIPDTAAKPAMKELAAPDVALAAETPTVVVPTGRETPDQGNESETTAGDAANAVHGRRSASWRTIDRARVAGAEIVVRDAGEASTAQAATNPAGTTSGTPTPATGTAVGLLGAAPTLAQMLAETVVSNTPRSPQPVVATAPETGAAPAVVVSPPVAVAAATIPVPPGQEVAIAPPPEKPAAETDGNDDATVGSEGNARPDSPVRGLREILASAGGKSGRAERASGQGGDAQNFQNVEKQRVGEGEAEIGMHTANKAQPMPSHATVLPPADAALERFELPAASAQPAGEVNGATPKPTADVGATRSFAAAAVREVMNAVERTQDTGHAHVELRLQTHDDESLRVHLQWRDGVVHARFVTQTSEMQRALSNEWDAVAPRMAEKGLKFSEPSFERNGQQPEQQPGQSGFAFNQQQRRSSSRSADADEFPDFALPLAKTMSADSSTRRPVLRTTTTNRIVLADARGLRVWA